MTRPLRVLSPMLDSDDAPPLILTNYLGLQDGNLRLPAAGEATVPCRLSLAVAQSSCFNVIPDRKLDFGPRRLGTLVGGTDLE
ncbi:hypothetical protein CEXT_276671 [Caerostris extrusa]|uniref:Uncharacterized protein n=1 Tax=Caerostris extrusa TaxID=172846 RepID=A0AAV4XDG2_CAEEX|nr:hypothetical protein CEXT_276671 [Caerostris extrusa]